MVGLIEEPATFCFPYKIAFNRYYSCGASAGRGPRGPRGPP